MNRSSPRTRSAEPAERVRARVVGLRRARPRDAAAPEHVVGDDERARRQAAPVDEGVEVRLVLGLEGVDEGHVERSRERRFPVGEGFERLGRDDRDPVVGDPGVAPPAAGEVGPFAVGVDRHDRAVGRLAEGHPQRRVTVGGPDLDDPAPIPRECRQHAPTVAIDDRDAERLGRGLDGEHRRGRRDADRLDPVEIGGVGDPVAVILHGLLLTRAGRRRSTGRRRGSCRPRSCRH